MLAGVVAVAQGCIGSIGGEADDAGPPGAGPLSCGDGPAIVEVQPLRRLSAAQYRNTVRELLGDPGLEFYLDEVEGPITEQAVRQIRDAGEIAVSRSDAWGIDVFGCDVTGAADVACVDAFIDQFGGRAFRRPVTDEERAMLREVYDEVAMFGTFAEAMETVLQVILAAPPTVYLYEAGTPSADSGALRALTGYEVASRLSYFLWDTMPDAALLDAAREGRLDRTDGIAAEAERMLDDPRAEAQVVDFFSGWMQLDGGRLHHALEDARKDANLFPSYDEALQEAMRTEVQAFVRRAFYEGDGRFDDLFTSRDAYVNGPLAELYGVDGVEGQDFSWVELDPRERAGLLTRAGFLTVYAAADVTAPIRRGAWMVEEVLCVKLGEPPPNVDDTPLEGGEQENGQVISVRQDVEARTSGPGCNGCHRLINPLGFAFETYDAIGRYQTEEVTSGAPVDASADIKGSDFDGPVADAVELSERLGESEQVRQCFARHWIDLAFGARGHEHAAIDECSKTTIEEQFAETGDMRELLIGILQSNAFRFITTEADS
ncbi:MAG: DUF1592 domain-containing protein [Myxococcota bacterium]